MRKIKEVLRLKQEKGLSNRQIGEVCAISTTTVGEYLRRIEAAGLRWPLSDNLSNTDLENKLFPPQESIPKGDRGTPDWNYIDKEMKRPSVTLELLWQEYRESHPNGYQYSWFCEHYRKWKGKLDLVMRQTHRAGEKLFVDYAVQTVPIVDRSTGEARFAQIFVAVMGASNYTYAEATWSQKLPDWIGSHMRCFQFLGGVPEIVVPDNLKSGVSKAHLYEPDLNPTYQDMAEHYRVAIIPARSRRPKDKAKADVGVQVVERMILAVLRNHTFFSLGQLNSALKELLDTVNRRAFKKLPGNRLEQFEAIDKPALSPLPSSPYLYAEWKKARVHIDYHIEVEGHYYSVPHALARRQVDVRITKNIIECFHQGERVTSHPRSYQKGRHTTQTAHMLESHRQQGAWTPERLIHWATKSGKATEQVITKILSSRTHPQQGFRSCLGILRLGERLGSDRLERSCQRALAFGTCSYKSIESILKNGLDQRPLEEEVMEAEQLELTPPTEHDNIRGAHYYH